MRRNRNTPRQAAFSSTVGSDRTGDYADRVGVRSSPLHPLHRQYHPKAMNLFDSFQIRDISFRNRIAVSPMCEYSSEDGFANDWHLVHLGSRAVGGAGTVLTEANAVVPEGRISPSDLGIWKDAHVENLGRIVRFLRQHGAVAGTQLAHAGFKASTGAPWRNHGDPVPIADGGWRPIYSSTAKGFTPESTQPEALTPQGIARIAHAFAEGSRRAREAGFELVE